MVHLLFDADVTGTAVAVCRFAGIALIGLGLACWPEHAADGGVNAARRGMLTYSLLAALYLGYLGFVRESVEMLLWPAVPAHVVVTILLGRRSGSE